MAKWNFIMCLCVIARATVYALIICLASLVLPDDTTPEGMAAALEGRINKFDNKVGSWCSISNNLSTTSTNTQGVSVYSIQGSDSLAWASGPPS